MTPDHPRGWPSELPPGRSVPNVLVFAYACEPGRGSEPGAGWGLVSAVSEFAECTVLVGPEQTETLKQFEAANPGTRIHHVEVPEPGWARFSKWHRIPWFLAYSAWLRAAGRVARDMCEAQHFDVVHHATYSVYWLPSPATDLPVPSVWGPVGGAVVTPLRLWPLLGWRGVISELVDLVSVRLTARIPAVRRTWQRATVPLVQNAETMARFPSAVRSGCSHSESRRLHKVEPLATSQRSDFLLWVGRLGSRKGARLAVRALAHAAPQVRLKIVGDGPERRALQRLAQKLGVADRVELLGWLERREVNQLMSEAAGVVFTGLREEGGLSLAEAMLVGAPVVALSHGGVRTIVASSTDSSRVIAIEPGGDRDTRRRLGLAMTTLVRQRPQGRGPLIDQADARRALEDAFLLAVSDNRDSG